MVFSLWKTEQTKEWECRNINVSLLLLVHNLPCLSYRKCLLCGILTMYKWDSVPSQVVNYPEYDVSCQSSKYQLLVVYLRKVHCLCGAVYPAGDTAMKPVDHWCVEGVWFAVCNTEILCWLVLAVWDHLNNVATRCFRAALPPLREDGIDSTE